MFVCFGMCVNMTHPVFAILLIGFKSLLLHWILCFRKLFSEFGIIIKCTEEKLWLFAEDTG